MDLIEHKRLLDKAIKLYKNRDYDGVRPILLELLEISPDDPDINFLCGSLHDGLGLEREAVLHYEKAISNRITGGKLLLAFIQLGSTDRCIGEYEKSIKLFKKGLKEFPDNLALKTFLGMALYNVNEDKQAITLLLEVLVKESNDPCITKYKRALKFYTENIDKIW